MKHLSESEFLATFAGPMQRVPQEADPPFDFWQYVETIPAEDYAGYDCSEGNVSNAWSDATGRYQHVLIDSEDKNVFMVVVLDLVGSSVFGHRILDLNHEYGMA